MWASHVGNASLAAMCAGTLVRPYQEAGGWRQMGAAGLQLWLGGRLVRRAASERQLLGTSPQPGPATLAAASRRSGRASGRMVRTSSGGRRATAAQNGTLTYDPPKGRLADRMDVAWADANRRAGC